MRCAECKHSSVADNKLLSCSNEHFKQGYWRSVSDILDGEVWVEDDEGWSFYVTPSFGCVHFEERTANTKEGVALNPYEMKLHEHRAIDANNSILRVPGGWVYNNTFVPWDGVTAYNRHITK